MRETSANKIDVGLFKQPRTARPVQIGRPKVVRVEVGSVDDLPPLAIFRALKRSLARSDWCSYWPSEEAAGEEYRYNSANGGTTREYRARRMRALLALRLVKIKDPNRPLTSLLSIEHNLTSIHVGSPLNTRSQASDRNRKTEYAPRTSCASW